ncbi:DNA repair protein rad16 [Phlyctema vagabunda]|uniref:DNA repair protein rad16 n=1 Tax=Phlyctema vagabunda TaxID=108571 RepID=A0ABR4P4H9_9HELO
MAPRGRPRRLAGHDTSSPATSRASSTRRSSRFITGPDTNTASGRASLSSASTGEDAESTGYSTPATSTFVTPQIESIPEVQPANTPAPKRRPGRPRKSIATATPAETSARLQALRNSQYSLDRGNKRKREGSDDEDEDQLTSADAQVARRLQAQENKKARIPLSATSAATGRSVARSSLSRNNYIADSMTEDDDDDSSLEMEISALGSRGLASAKSKVATPSRKAKVELGPKGTNKIEFTTTSTTTKEEILASDEDDEDDDFLDDGSDSDAPLASLGRRSAIAPTKSESSLDDIEFKVPGRRLTTASNSKYFNGASKAVAGFKREDTAASSALSSLGITDTDDYDSEENIFFQGLSEDEPGFSDFETEDDGEESGPATAAVPRRSTNRRGRTVINLLESRQSRRAKQERSRLELHHPELHTMWKDLENLPKVNLIKAEQPKTINRELKPFQLEGLSWMKGMEETEWGGGLLGDEMGMGKTIQAVSLIMSDWPAKQPSLVLIPPVALMQWQQEIADYTDGTLKTFVFHGQNAKTKTMTKADLMKYNVILMSYNSLESMYRKQEKGFKRKGGLHKEKSVIHQIQFHRVILDEAHNIKQRTTGCAKACFALKADHKWCLSGTPLQNRIGEFFSLVRFLDIRPFACYFCKQCPCSTLNWEMNADNRCTGCNHSGMQHVSVFNQELLNPIQKFGNKGPGEEAFRKLRLLTDRFMLRRVKRDHSAAMELPAKEINVDRHFFGEVENDFAGSIMNNGTRKFDTYVAQGVLLNNYANIFGLIMQMRQVADHPDLILKKNTEGGQNILVCCICDETAEEAIRSTCKHEFCRECAKSYLGSSDEPDCPQCHIPLSIDLEQPDIEQDEQLVKKSSIINRIKMENWTSSTKIEALVHNLHELRSKNSSTKSIIFSQFTTMLQLVEWRLRRAGITTVLLDGSMTPAQRQSSINHFMTNVNVECFLVSLKAGGVALNLTEASHVFIVDPWWNPAAEWQSADRCHRIGQARPCSITRLCIEDSVESRMVLLQEKKANMINSTINADESAMESLTPEDMQFLFRGT